MTEPSWKAFERRCAALLSGRRYPANTGGVIDIESESWIGQCKEVKELSLESLTALVAGIEAEAVRRGKHGCVFVKIRRGRGRPSPTLFVADASTVVGDGVL